VTLGFLYLIGTSFKTSYKHLDFIRPVEYNINNTSYIGGFL
jgi:hypothetical protein